MSRALGRIAIACAAAALAAPARAQHDLAEAEPAQRSGTAALDAAPALEGTALEGSALEGSGGSEGSEAATLFRVGIALRESGDTTGAIDRLRRAHRLEPAPRTAYNLAAALADAGRYVEARALLRRLVAAGVDDDLLIHEAARELLARVEPQIATLEVQIAASIPGQRVVIDGARAIAREVGLDPGAHRVEVRSPEGAVLARSHVRLEPGQHEQITLRPVGGAAIAGDPGSPSVAPDALAPDERDDGETWMWVGIGAGAAVVLTAIITGVAIAVSDASRDDAMPMPMRMRMRDD